MIPIVRKGGKITVMGLPFHGVVYDGQFTKPDSSVVPVPGASPVNHLLDMGHQLSDRTGNELDAAEGYEWRSKLLLSGVASLPSNQFVFVDGNNVPWIIDTTYIQTINTKEYRLRCSVKCRFGLFQAETPLDLDYQFYDSGLLNYEVSTADLGLFNLQGVTLNQDSRGENVAVCLKGGFVDNAVDPMLSWLNNERAVVDVRVLSVSGIVDPDTGAGLVANYVQVVSVPDCCGGMVETSPNEGTYTSFAYTRHRWSINTPKNVRSSSCVEYNAPYSGISQDTEGGAEGDNDVTMYETAPGGSRYPLLTDTNTFTQKIQYAVINAYYANDDLKIVRVKCQEFDQEEGISLAYSYESSYRFTNHLVMTRDNDCRYVSWDSEGISTELENLNYVIERRRGYTAAIEINGLQQDLMEVYRSVTLTSTRDINSNPPPVVTSGTDELIAGGFPIWDDFDETTPFGGLNDIPVGVESDLKLVVNLSGVETVIPDAQYGGFFEYPVFRTVKDIAVIGNNLAGYDLYKLENWEGYPGYNYQSLIGPDSVKVLGQVGAYAVYDPFELSIHNDTSRQLCVI